MHPQPAAGLNCVNLIVFEFMVTALSCFRKALVFGLKKGSESFMLPEMFSCIFRNSRTVMAYCLLSLGPLVASATEVEESSEVSDRDKFKSAVRELRTGVGPRLSEFAQELDDYPLAVYLDALVIEGTCITASLRTLKHFCRQQAGPNCYSDVT